MAGLLDRVPVRDKWRAGGDRWPWAVQEGAGDMMYAGH